MGDGVVVLVSIDTEEDNWYRSRENVSLRNLGQLPRIGSALRALGVRPTFFTTYQVARDAEAAALVREACADSGEIAAHLHPWNTPPLTEAFIPRNSMLKNLPADLQRAKLERLTATIEGAFGVRPRAFRAGRYGLGPDTVGALAECGYAVDSSVTPFLNWEGLDDGPTFFGAPVEPYRLSPGRDIRRHAPDGVILEVPLSAGFVRGPVRWWDPARRLVDAAPARRLRLAGQAALAGLLKRAVLSPELSTAAEMLALSRRLLDQGVLHLHMSFHSPTLLPGLGPYAATAPDVARLYQAIDAYFHGLVRLTSFRMATVSDAAAMLCASSPNGHNRGS